MGTTSRVPVVSTSLVSGQLLILGGGFGLYGYVPAAIQTSWQVTTLSRYKGLLENRTELSGLLNQVDFISETDLDPQFYDAIVIARTPRQQFDFVQANPTFQGHYFLEKPLGDTEESTLQLLDTLQSRKSSFSVAYLFEYQEWYKHLASGENLGTDVAIDWRISSPKNRSWKESPDAGGGILAYYGVHLLSLIVDCAYDLRNLEISHQTDLLEIKLKNSSREISLKLSVGQISSFEVVLKGRNGVYHWSRETPFGVIPTPGIPDPRIPALIEYLSGWSKHKSLSEFVTKERKILELRQTISAIL